MYLRPATENLQNKLIRESQTERIPLADDANDASNGDSDSDDDENSSNVTNIIRYFSEAATLCGVLSYIIFQQGDEIKNQGFVAFSKQLVRIINNLEVLLNLFDSFLYFFKKGSCTSQGNILDIKLFDSRLYTISTDWRYRHRRSNLAICCARQLVFTHVLRWVRMIDDL